MVKHLGVKCGYAGLEGEKDYKLICVISCCIPMDILRKRWEQKGLYECKDN